MMPGYHSQITQKKQILEIYNLLLAAKSKAVFITLVY